MFLFLHSRWKLWGQLLLLPSGVLVFSSGLTTRQQLHLPQLTITSSFQRDRTVTALYVLADLFDAETTTTEGKESSSRNSKNTLIFQSSFETQSEALEPVSNDERLTYFLMNPDHLMSAMESVQPKIIPTTEDLLDEWRTACHAVGAAPPNVDHGILMEVRTAGISIPGLSVQWSALIGTNLVMPKTYHPNTLKSNSNPELEFVLIKDETKVSKGAKAIVWIFEKLSRARNRRRESRRHPSNPRTMDTKLFSRLGFFNDHETDDPSLHIRCKGYMEMNFKIPSLVGKLMSSSQDIATTAAGPHVDMSQTERKVSDLITRQIEKDMKKTVSRWEETYRSWRTRTDQL